METEAINKFLQEFQKESDRASAILGVCYLDKCVDTLLKYYFISDSKYISKNIIGSTPGVVLDSFSKKVKVAYAVGLLRQEEFDDLESIRKIRNDFAHGLHGLSFESQTIRDKCQNLKIAQSAIGGPLIEAKYTDSPRFRYILSVAIIGHFMNYRAKNEIKNRNVWKEGLY